MTHTTRFLLPAVVLLVLQGCSQETPTPTVVDAPTPAPAVTVTDTPTPAAAMTTKFQDLQGNPLELSAYAGKRVFVNYWATWCAPCIREIPSIARATAELEDENYVVVLASDESLDTIKDFIAEREFTGNFIKLNAFFGAHGIDAVPSSELYDESGALVVTWSGAYEWDSAEMLAAIRNGTPVVAPTAGQ